MFALDLLGRVFGSEKALSKVVDNVSSGLDKLYYSDEEKADDATKARTEARGMVVKWMQATQGQNLARRIIALMVTGCWISQYLISQALNVTAVWSDKAEQLQQSAIILQKGAVDMNSAAMLVLAFYFAAPHMGDIAKSILERKRTNV